MAERAGKSRTSEQRRQSQEKGRDRPQDSSDDGSDAIETGVNRSGGESRSRSRGGESKQEVSRTESSDGPVDKEEQLDKWHERQKDQGRTDTSATLEPLTEASAQDWLGSNQDPDVLLAVPNLGVDYIGIKVKNLRAHVELHAKVLDLLELHVGAEVSVDEVDIEIDNVRVQAMLKVKLEQVVNVVSRVMDTIDENPEILTNLTGGLGRGLEGALANKSSEQMDEEQGEGGDDSMQLKGPPDDGDGDGDSDGEEEDSGGGGPKRPRSVRG